MPVICPTITATDEDQYSAQIKVIEPFVDRLHVVVMDGVFAPSKSPPLDKVWWPAKVMADIHLMYERPMDYVDSLIKLRPHMVIIHVEAEVDHEQFCSKLAASNIKCGLALLQDTPVSKAEVLLPSFDQVLIFSGHLGYHGGNADLNLLTKVLQVKDITPNIEIAWDGGISEDNIKALAEGGVDVLNVGSSIHANPDPKQAYAKLKELAKA